MQQEAVETGVSIPFLTGLCLLLYDQAVDLDEADWEFQSPS